MNIRQYTGFLLIGLAAALAIEGGEAFDSSAHRGLLSSRLDAASIGTHTVPSVLLRYGCRMNALWGTAVLPSPAEAQENKYKKAVPVVDTIKEEKTQTATDTKRVVEQNKKSTFYTYVLSRNFLSILLSCLILFLSVYLYLKYAWKRPKTKTKWKKHSHREEMGTFIPQKKGSAETVNGLKTSPDAGKNDNSDISEEFDLIEETSLSGNAPGSNGQASETGQLKVKRIEHARKIAHLLEKL
ncbi:hypothetical protein LLG96_03765 [bacterium]|nr:hypothetical protein [bacterium]